MKPLLLVHVDIDSLKTVAKFFGVSIRDDTNPVYNVAIPRFIELFQKYGILAMFFIIGEDLNNKSNTKIISHAVSEGHDQFRQFRGHNT